MFPKFALERGCRTIVFFPDDEVTYVALAVQYKPHSVPSFIAYSGGTTYGVYAENENVLLYTKFVATNALEYQKLYLEAYKAKPYRLDYMASEDIFFYTKAECVADYDAPLGDYAFGIDALRQPLEARMQIHYLFKLGGHMNFYLGQRNFPTTYSVMLTKFMEYAAIHAIRNVARPEPQVVFSTATTLPGAETAPYAPQEEINYDQITSMSVHIYGNQGRTAIPRAKVPLFHKRRRLDYTQFPEDFQQYIAVVVLPDDITHTEMRVWQDIVFDRLYFAGVEFVTRSAALIGFSGRSGVCFASSARQSAMLCVEPFYPVLNGLLAPLAVNVSSLVHAFYYFIRQCPQLMYSAKLLGCVVEAADIAAKNYARIFNDLGVPSELIARYEEQSEAYRAAVVSNILFQANQQVLYLFTQRAFSLEPNDNYYCKFRICFPIPNLATYGPKDVCAVEASVRFGPVGLAVASLLNHPGALPPALRSARFLETPGPRDPLLEQRDVPKTTKVQLERHELGDVLVQGRRAVDFGEELNQDNILAGAWDLLAGFFRFVCGAHLKNEDFMRAQGRRVEEQRNAESEAQELLASRKKTLELFQNLAFHGRLWQVGGFRETVRTTLQGAFPEYQATEDEFLAAHEGGIWMCAALLSLTDGMMENCVCREEYAGIGSRVWIEKAPFLYP